MLKLEIGVCPYALVAILVGVNVVLILLEDAYGPRRTAFGSWLDVAV